MCLKTTCFEAVCIDIKTCFEAVCIDISAGERSVYALSRRPTSLMLYLSLPPARLLSLPLSGQAQSASTISDSRLLLRAPSNVRAARGRQRLGATVMWHPSNSVDTACSTWTEDLSARKHLSLTCLQPIELDLKALELNLLRKHLSLTYLQPIELDLSTTN